MSDLHLDHYSDRGRSFLDSLSERADVGVVAGDIGDGRFPDQYLKLFQRLRDVYDNVVVITGNHDYYKSTIERTHNSILLAASQVPNVHFLNRSSVTIDDRTFYGGTMWYRFREDNYRYENYMNDTAYIQDLNKWVYQENELFTLHLEGRLTKDDVVVTHHLPHYLSVDDMYKRSESNRFFVCNMDKLIRDRQPRLWLHGHTHTDAHYWVKKTEIVCHPRGYPRERQRVYKPKIIEI